MGHPWVFTRKTWKQYRNQRNVECLLKFLLAHSDIECLVFECCLTNVAFSLMCVWPNPNCKRTRFSNCRNSGVLEVLFSNSCGTHVNRITRISIILYSKYIGREESSIENVFLSVIYSVSSSVTHTF